VPPAFRTDGNRYPTAMVQKFHPDLVDAIAEPLNAAIAHGGG